MSSFILEQVSFAKVIAVTKYITVRHNIAFVPFLNEPKNINTWRQIKAMYHIQLISSINLYLYSTFYYLVTLPSDYERIKRYKKGKEIQNQFLSEKKHPLDYSGKLSWNLLNKIKSQERLSCPQLLRCLRKWSRPVIFETPRPTINW